MADRKILTHLDFLKASELQNALVHKLASAPGSPVEGQLYYDTATHKLYYYNNTSWVACEPSGAVVGGEGLLLTGSTLDVRPGAGIEIVADLVRIAAAAAGEGLSGGAGSALAVNVDGTFLKITADVLTPQTEGSGTKLATTGYVDNVAQGLDVKNSCRVATNAVLSPASVQSGNELVGEGVGALAAVDGKTLIVGDRLLVKDEAAGTKRGIYEVLSVGGGAEKYKLKRTTDADATGDMSGGTFTFIEEGTANGDTGWVISEPTGPITIGVTSSTWTQFTGAGLITAGGGIGKTGNLLFVEGLAGLVQEGDGLKVDTTTIATKAFVEEKAGGKFSQNIGTGAATSIEVEHKLATRDVTVEVYRNSTPWDSVDCTVERPSTEKVKLTFNTAPTSEQFRVVIRS